MDPNFCDESYLKAKALMKKRNFYIVPLMSKMSNKCISLSDRNCGYCLLN